MSKTLKIILGLLGLSIIFFVLVVAILFRPFWHGEMCGINLIESKTSPNKKLEILVFSADCGATTDFSTQISIKEYGYELKKEDNGNVFSADSDHGKAKMNGEIIELKTKWLNDDTIIVEYNKEARIFRNKASENGVKIIYKKLE